jgi:hypothetical protein
MWYEVLPSLGVIFGAMTLAMYGTQLVPYLGLNHVKSKAASIKMILSPNTFSKLVQHEGIKC